MISERFQLPTVLATTEELLILVNDLLNNIHIYVLKEAKTCVLVKIQEMPTYVEK